MTKELEACFKRIKNLQVCVDYEKDIVKSVNEILPNSCNKVEQALQRLESIDNANPSEALECLDYIENKVKDLEYVAKQNDNEYLLSKYIPSEKFNTIKQALLKAQEQEKENELLKEIIKSLFDRGCPLHQYIDKDFGLTIEVDDECSILHLGKYKGVDLDKKLKEVLDNE